MKQYIKPEIEILKAQIYAVLENTSHPEPEQVNADTVESSGDDVFMSKGDIFDLVSSENERRNNWPSYSAWDE